MADTYKIFAYGSLLNPASLKKTVPDAGNLIPAKAHGFRRIFNLASHYRFDKEQNAPVCVLNLEVADQTFMVNGVCFEMDDASIDNLLQREAGYDFRELKVRHYHDDNEIAQVHYFHALEFEPYRFLSGSHAQRHYLNLCLQGSKLYGMKFLRDFKQSTTFWGIDDEVTHQSIWQGEY